MIREVINELKKYTVGKKNSQKAEISVLVLNRLIFALKEQESCDDVISRQAALDIVDSYSESQSNVEDVTQDIISDIMALPPATPESKAGRWIIKDGKEQGYDIAGIKTWYVQIMCDKCGFIKTVIEGRTEQYHYCPNCGQPKMQEVEE